ncbi:hypothetical protein PAPYR_9341 [Paratrimastix pyriformis]|uniref:Uncharacterized protein n=1 Tax=Paratrimastix pyriformis TaxID=342808 RepID=A0ABQ8UDC5_9EUKA|nr:hypothetical protein PAPYR_9341 [Paratrimastix pyriformis]
MVMLRSYQRKPWSRFAGKACGLVGTKPPTTPPLAPPPVRTTGSSSGPGARSQAVPTTFYLLLGGGCRDSAQKTNLMPVVRSASLGTPPPLRAGHPLDELNASGVPESTPTPLHPWGGETTTPHPPSPRS